MIEHEQIPTNLQYTKTSVTSFKSTNMSSAFSDLTPGQTVKKVVTRTEMRTVRTLDGKVVEDTYDPGSAQTTVERYTFDNRAVNGSAPRTSAVISPGCKPRAFLKASALCSATSSERVIPPGDCMIGF